jgi:hypothetical protein
MNETLEEWKAHIIKTMKDSLEGLSHENLPDHLFNFMMQNLQNGMRFLANEREEGLKKNDTQ